MNTYSKYWISGKKILPIFLTALFLLTDLSATAHPTLQKEMSASQTSLSISDNLSIKDLFKLISKKTSYRFFYNAGLKDLDKKVSVNVNNKEVPEILQLVFNQTNLEFKIHGKEILIREKKQPSTKKTVLTKQKKSAKIIMGVVTDETDMPLPGVTVVIKGTNKGTTTDFDGKYNIEAQTGDILLFSYMGYKDQTIKVGDKTKINIKMVPSANALDEVIIAGVASGTSKKKMSVSVSKVKSSQINLAAPTSVATALSGKVAGASINSFSGSPGSGPQIILRGATQLNGSQAPMILLDGVIMNGSLADINADDIESVEIVKGAAASSLYGSKAGNGVIVITSKRGKKLKKNQTLVTIRNKAGVQQVGKYLELSQSHPYELALDWLSTDKYTKYNFVNYPADYDGGWNPNVNGVRLMKSDHYMDLPYRVNHDFQKELFTDGLSYTNYVAISNRGEKTNMFLSFENYRNQGIVIETGGYARQSIRANIDHQLSKSFKISASNNFIKTNNDFMGGGTGAFFNALMMEPDANIYKNNPDGQKYYYYPSQWTQIVHNPLYDLWRKESHSNKLRYLGSYKAKWKINKWLRFENAYAIEVQNYDSDSYTPFGTFNGLDQTTNTFTTSGGSLSKYTQKALNQTFRSTLNFKHKWDKLNFNGKLSYLYENSSINSFSTSGTDFLLPDLPSLNYVVTSLKNDDYKSQILAKNYFAIASFVYDNRYILDALYRRDGSSLFGENQRWQNYYRFSGAYRISEAVKIPKVQELKLRMAYGKAGQRPGFDWQYETFYNNNGVFSKNTLGNKNLKPSKSTEVEIGLDAAFLERFNLEATYSQTITTDQFVKKPLAPMFGGFKYQWVNDGTLVSKTFEANLRSKIINNKTLNWNAGISFDKTTSKITELGIPGYSIGPRSAFRFDAGEVYGNMYGWDFVRTLEQMEAQLPTGESIDDYSVNSDGVVVKTADIGTVNEKAFHLLDADRNNKIVKIGNVNPDFRLSLNSTLQYKNFSFYMLWKWKQGGDIYNATAQYLVRDLRHPMMDQIHTKPENKKTVDYYQSLYDADAVNGFWVEDGTYVRLGEASIYYKLKFKKDTKINKYLSAMKIGLTGNNLLTFTNYSGYDPETGYSGFTFDNYGYPNFRRYTLSLELKF